MNTDKIAKGWALIAEGAMELSLAYSAIDTSASGHGADYGTGGAKADSPPPSPVPALPDMRQVHVDTVLGQCPDHQRPWTVKPGGISRNGKPYSSFWRCAMKNGDTWCEKKPVKAWVDSHPIEEGAAA